MGRRQGEPRQARQGRRLCPGRTEEPARRSQAERAFPQRRQGRARPPGPEGPAVPVRIRRQAGLHGQRDLRADRTGRRSLGDRRPFLQDGMIATVEYYGEEALSVSIPQKVTCTVAETEPVVKGQTAANSYKPAILDNGVRIMIPPFVGEGEAIVVNTEMFEYSERA
ncbi:translation elongation factor P [marine sediment metagenome]|uniref:Translation elongation factor P n=1 Tax=marine sediment metagenome TaxID=412755 RepID=A0A1B6NX88_9ZZZZ